MLNPTERICLNANEVDLNRDSQNLTQPESKVLREIFDLFQPHYCFNLHDQRTILSRVPVNTRSWPHRITRERERIKNEGY
jgi:hypothetical protein